MAKKAKTTRESAQLDPVSEWARAARFWLKVIRARQGDAGEWTQRLGPRGSSNYALTVEDLARLHLLEQSSDLARRAEAEGIDSSALLSLAGYLNTLPKVRPGFLPGPRDFDIVNNAQIPAARLRARLEGVLDRAAASKSAKKDALPKLSPKHEKVLAVLREFGDHGAKISDIAVLGVKGKTMQRHLDLLRRHKLVELVKGTHRWRVIGQ